MLLLLQRQRHRQHICLLWQHVDSRIGLLLQRLLLLIHWIRLAATGRFLKLNLSCLLVLLLRHVANGCGLLLLLLLLLLQRQLLFICQLLLLLMLHGIYVNALGNIQLLRLLLLLCSNSCCRVGGGMIIWLHHIREYHTSSCCFH